MEEKLYKKMKSVGVSNLVFGIVTIAFGIGAGVMMILMEQDFLHINQIYYFKCIYCLIYYCNVLTGRCNGMSGILYCVERDYE